MSKIVMWTAAYGSYGAMSGARTATTTEIPSIVAPMTPMGCLRNRRQRRRGSAAGVACWVASITAMRSLLAHARIEPAVDELRGEVRDDHRHGEQEKRPLEHRVVPIVDRINRERAEARPAEDGLDLDRAGHGEAERQGDQRHHRQHCVAESVVSDD